MALQDFVQTGKQLMAEGACGTSNVLSANLHRIYTVADLLHMVKAIK